MTQEERPETVEEDPSCTDRAASAADGDRADAADATPPSGIDRSVVHAATLAALALALLVRVPYFVGLDFPLNDGGLFLAMVEAIRAAGFALPQHVDYNGLAIPFGYPPAAFYLTAALAELTGVAPLTLQLYLPLVFNLGCVVLFVRLLAELVDRPATLFLAAATFPLIPRSYEWMIMGGGLSRSPGFFLMLVSALLALRVARRPDPGRIVLCTLAMGATLATHLEWGITTWVSCALMILWRDTTLRSAAIVVAMGFGMGIVSLPWWGTVVWHHGIDPFLAAGATSGWQDVTFFDRLKAFDLFTMRHSWFGVVAAAGFGLALHQRRALPCLWVGLIFLTTPRHGSTVAAMPTAIFAAIALTAAADAASRAYADWQRRRGALVDADPEAAIRPLALAVAFVAFFTAIAQDTRTHHEFTPLIALSPAERAGMEWIRRNTDEQDRFVVVSDARDWAVDRTAEWFPVLAGRAAANTAQGLEWVKELSFSERTLMGDVHRQVVNTSPTTAPILGRKIFDGQHTHVAVFAEPGSPVITSYDQSSRYERVHAQPHLSVYRTRLLRQPLGNAPATQPES